MASLRFPSGLKINHIKPRLFLATTTTTTTNTLPLSHHNRTFQNKSISNSLKSRCITSPNTSFLARLFSSKPDDPAMASAARTKAEAIINENAVAVFSKSYCPHCKAAKSLLTEMGAKFYVIDLDQVDDGSAIQAALGEISGQTTVPNIFINKKHIGGNSDLQAKKKELKNLLKEAGAL